MGQTLGKRGKKGIVDLPEVCCVRRNTDCRPCRSVRRGWWRRARRRPRCRRRSAAAATAATTSAWYCSVVAFPENLQNALRTIWGYAGSSQKPHYFSTTRTGPAAAAILSVVCRERVWASACVCVVSKGHHHRGMWRPNVLREYTIYIYTIMWCVIRYGSETLERRNRWDTDIEREKY